ncbi:unnamed protein product [Camellia sinensis]
MVFESKFIQKIVEVVANKLRCTILGNSPYLIGMHSRAKNIGLWLQDECSDVGIVAIYGIGGIGKTTIAKLLYNSYFSIFEGSSFLANVRETLKQPNGLLQLQRQLHSDILKKRKENLYNVHEGIVKIKDALCCKRVFVILDDVDTMDQLDAILGMRDWLFQGSKIIITTRRERLLRAHEVCKVHKVKNLDYNESLELFSWHAFGKNRPIDGFIEDSERVVQYCGGLPLAIKILGSSLSGRTLNVWKSQLQKLKAIPNSEVIEKLKISYDSLQDDHDKNLFLHVACFFVGMDEDLVVTILNECDFYAMGTGKIEGLILDMNFLEDKYCRTVFGVNRKHQANSFKRPWFGIFSYHTEGTTLGNLDKIALEIDAFARIQKLKLLQLKYLQVSGSFENFPKGLRWLSWHEFPFKSICDDFPLESLVVLEMRYNNLQKVWEGTKFLESLKILDLKVHESIGHLQRLVLLNLKDCKNLRKLPRSIVMLKFLETLDISGCSNIKELPTEIGTMDSLTKLIVNRIAIIQLLYSTKEVKPRLILNLSNNPFCSLPNCIRGLTGLQILKLNECKRLQSLTVEQNVKVLSIAECTLLEKNLEELKCALHSAPSTMEYIWKNQFVVIKHWSPFLFYGMCDNIVEIMGEFKLEPLGNIDMEIMNNLGLPNLGSMGSPTVTLSSRYSENPRKLPLQGCHEEHIFYAYLSESKIPTWTKSLTWSHSPFAFGIPEANEDMMWLSYWKFENQLEGGDELNISVVGNEDFQVREVGVHLVYKEEEEKSSQSTSEEASSQLQFSLYGNVVPGNASGVHPVSKKVYRLGGDTLTCWICDDL